MRLRDTRHRRDRANSPVTGLFVAIGHDPRSELFRGQVDLDDAGLREGRRHPTTRTNLDGVFACGDLVDHTYRQAITAAGTGCAAALDAERWLADPRTPEHNAVARRGVADHRLLRQPAPDAHRPTDATTQRQEPTMGATTSPSPTPPSPATS